MHWVRNRQSTLTFFGLITLAACQPAVTYVSPRAEVDCSRQLMVVITPSWTSTTGTMTRFERSGTTSSWSRIDPPIPIVVVRMGLAWVSRFDGVLADPPDKHECDGKAPSVIFPLHT